MNKKRTLLTVLAMVLVCALSVAGTLALLAEDSGPVTNTFVAASTGGDFVDNFEIKEYAIAPDGKGNYTLTNTETDANSYTVVPGVTLDKDAFVKLTRTNETPAYLFIEVVNTLDSDVFTMDVDTQWGELAGVTGKYNGDVYVLGTAANPTVLNAVTDGKYHIISGNKVTVADNNDLGITAGSTDTIKFYAYISQATVTKNGANTNVPADVFEICF